MAKALARAIPGLHDPAAQARRWRLDIAFDGRDFFGFQAQPNNTRTVQDTLEAALAPLGVLQERLVSAGRTDTGVHASRMPLHADLATTLAPAKLQQALNARLPADLQVLALTEAAPGFHARFTCQWRAYRYRLSAGTHFRHPLLRHYSHAVFYPLDVAAMQAAAHLLIGEHNFASFATQEERQPWRKLLECRLESGSVLGLPTLDVVLVGESFLRHMVRGIVGTLIDVGRGKTKPEAINTILTGRQRALAGPNMPANGLVFENAGYDDEAW
jgi:tRNA pseudouridine38-40 synthase